MNASETLALLHEARQLADSGRHAGVVQYLRNRASALLTTSPTLALLYGTALARLGQHDRGAHWVELAIKGAGDRADRAVRRRALNVRGAIALDNGQVQRARTAFAEGLKAARADGDHGMTGKCATNLGIIANMQGDYDDAVSRYTTALASFEQASLPWGIVVTRHNLAITLRDRGEFLEAFETADRAVTEAGPLGDRALSAQTLAGRAEMRLPIGDARVARPEIEHALSEHRELGDVVGAAEDLRIKAMVLAALDQMPDAVGLLTDVIVRAKAHGRPLLRATAHRDLALLSHQMGQATPTRKHAAEALEIFSRMGCAAEVRRMNRVRQALDPGA